MESESIKTLPAQIRAGRGAETTTEKATLAIKTQPLPHITSDSQLKATLISQTSEGKATIMLAGQKIEVEVSDKSKLPKTFLVRKVDQANLQIVELETVSVQTSTTKGVSDREKILLSALTATERAFLRRVLSTIVNLGPESSQAESNGKKQQVFSQEEINTLKTNILNSKNIVKSPEKQGTLALELISRLSGKLPNANIKSNEASLALLKLLETLKAQTAEEKQSQPEIISAIKNQSRLPPEQRATLLQSVASQSLENKSLIETLLNRREDIIVAKRNILALIQKLNPLEVPNNINHNPIIEETSEIIRKYLQSLLSDIATKLTTIDQSKVNKEIRLLLLEVKHDIPSFNSNTSKSNSPERSLLPVLALADLLDQISNNNADPSTTNEQRIIGSTRPELLREILKELILKKNESVLIQTNSMPSAHEKDLTATATEFPSLESVTKNLFNVLNSKIGSLDNFTEGSHDLNKLSAKLIVQTNSLKELLYTIRESLSSKFSSTVLESFTAEQISEIALDSLKLAIDTKSPEIFRASAQFLKSSLAKADIVTAITSLLLPIFDILAASTENDSTQTAKLRELIEEIKNLGSKISAKSKELLLSKLEKLPETLTGIRDREMSSTINNTEQKIKEILLHDSLQKLNTAAEKLSQPNFTIIPLPASNSQLTLELRLDTLKKLVTDEDQDGEADGNDKGKAERIECSMLLPNLGECGITISIFENQINLSICNAKQEVVSTALSLSNQLKGRIEELGFERTNIDVNCKTPSSVKPSWLLEILGKSAEKN